MIAMNISSLFVLFLAAELPPCATPCRTSARAGDDLGLIARPEEPGRRVCPHCSPASKGPESGRPIDRAVPACDCPVCRRVQRAFFQDDEAARPCRCALAAHEAARGPCGADCPCDARRGSGMERRGADNRRPDCECRHGAPCLHQSELRAGCPHAAPGCGSRDDAGCPGGCCTGDCCAAGCRTAKRTAACCDRSPRGCGHQSDACRCCDAQPVRKVACSDKCPPGCCEEGRGSSAGPSCCPQAGVHGMPGSCPDRTDDCPCGPARARRMDRDCGCRPGDAPPHAPKPVPPRGRNL